MEPEICQNRYVDVKACANFSLVYSYFNMLTSSNVCVCVCVRVCVCVCWGGGGEFVFN